MQSDNQSKWATIRISRMMLDRLDGFRESHEVGEPSRREAGDYLLSQALDEEGY
ncbi:hypothetical protein SAMN04488063_1116 [Halopelagius inordinatus]|uniref:Uncharacterized protein n=1 Tax=Halopelagius inordinatus TaxID=553467 RepID=A0A1I2NDE3_9EURY|nr:hypothetical protein [Halopelagius inordinatus]SFG00879.1 hypothetical protein SAMN04488063_1116 [Halopelagius inordinatus]